MTERVGSNPSLGTSWTTASSVGSEEESPRTPPLVSTPSLVDIRQFLECDLAEVDQEELTKLAKALAADGTHLNLVSFFTGATPLSPHPPGSTQLTPHVSKLAEGVAQILEKQAKDSHHVLYNWFLDK